MNAVRLIAGREFRAYVATASFWIALLVGPALAAGAAALSGGHGQAARPAELTLAPARGGGFIARFGDGFPASPAARAEIVRVIAADGGLKGPLRLAPPAPRPARDPQAVSRFVLSLSLFLTLTGSLGMLLQAVVRERANRALETLLAAARPGEIVAGKLAGVGGVSALVAASWVGSGVAVAGGGGGGALLAAFSDPATVLGALGLYVLAFAFYGFVVVAIGARARDSAAAQNLARPLFALLLAVFFVTLAEAFGARALDALVYLPPFTPFLLLMRPPGPPGEIAAVAVLALSAVAAGWLAAASVGLEAGAPRFGSFLRRNRAP